MRLLPKSYLTEPPKTAVVTILIPPSSFPVQADSWASLLNMLILDTKRTVCVVETEIPESEWVARAARGDEDAFFI